MAARFALRCRRGVLLLPPPGSVRSVHSLLHHAGLRVKEPQGKDRKTAIICTVGPSTWDPKGLRALLKEGMNVARLNFSHGTHEEKARIVNDLRTVVAEIRKEGGDRHYVDFSDGSREDTCAIAADIQGPKIRTGRFLEGDSIPLKRGQIIVLNTDRSMAKAGTPHEVFVDYEGLADEIAIGQRIFLDDGLISIQVTGKGGTRVTCRVDNDAVLGARKGVNIPTPFVSRLPSITAQDVADLKFAVENHVDFIFASYVRKAENVHAIRSALGERGKDIRIISKIENQEGCDNFDEIMYASDGIMLARGDLGIEIPPERVFLAQKMMIARCNIVGKPVICATQMLESMVVNPRPTRAECNDVANAVLDGADAVMLSAETAKGRWPFEALSIMSRICREAEVVVDHRHTFSSLLEANANSGLKSSFPENIEAIASSAVIAASQMKAAAILVLSANGKTARAVSKYRPACPIVVGTDNEKLANTLVLHRGVKPIVISKEMIENPDDAIAFLTEVVRDMGLYTGTERLVAVRQYHDSRINSRGPQSHLIFI